ncbi:AraC family transcriptional regulator [Sphingobacterium siyangense]|uniref:AraC family transcriptional regulator n=1 Tax=Sphingobacterium siyangense TaxID=459529 RepID=UPI003DA28967
MNANVIVKEINPLKMVYVSHIGVQGLDSSFYKIIDWVRKKELVSENEIDIVRIYHDSFKITPPDKVRMEIGVPVKEKVKTEFDIQYREIQPKLCVVGSFEISLDEFEKSWSSMFIWMNENRYKPSEEKPFEIIHNNYTEHPQKKCVVDFYIPVR